MTAVYFTNNRNKVIRNFHSVKNDVTLEVAYGNLQWKYSCIRITDNHRITTYLMCRSDIEHFVQMVISKCSSDIFIRLKISTRSLSNASPVYKVLIHGYKKYNVYEDFPWQHTRIITLEKVWGILSYFWIEKEICFGPVFRVKNNNNIPIKIYSLNFPFPYFNCTSLKGMCTM